LSLLNFFDPGFWASLTMLGYTGIFLASFLGSLLPFVSGPYVPPIILGIVAGRLDPASTALLSAAGAASGKVILFNVFKGGRRLLSRGSLERIEPLERVLRRYGWVAVLLTAATPLPDDIMYLLLAVAGYRSAYFFPLVFAGKLLITTAVAYVAFYWAGLACLLVECGPTGITPESALLFGILSAGAAMGLVYLITRLDWGSILKRVGLDA